MRDPVSSIDLSQRFPSRSSSDGLLDLKLAELGLPSEPHSPSHRSSPSRLSYTSSAIQSSSAPSPPSPISSTRSDIELVLDLFVSVSIDRWGLGAPPYPKIRRPRAGQWSRHILQSFHGPYVCPSGVLKCALGGQSHGPQRRVESCEGCEGSDRRAINGNT
jgi:hypothetical protein